IHPLSVFFILTLLPPISTLFPYTTLFRSTFAYYYASYLNGNKSESAYQELLKAYQLRADEQELWDDLLSYAIIYNKPSEAAKFADRKSTRLNSSHVKISYAVFCLKKKK